MKDERIMMPQSTGGLRMFQDVQVSKFQLSPQVVITIIIAIIIAIILLHTFGTNMIKVP